MLKRLLILLIIAATANSTLGMGYLFEQLGKQEESTSSSKPMSLDKENYLDFKNSLKRKLDTMPKNISQISSLDKAKLEELKKAVGLNFAKEYEDANRKGLASKAYGSIKSKFIADGFSFDEQTKRRDDIQARHSLLLSIIYHELLANLTEQPKARL